MSNNLGNQMFMYASALSFSKQLDRELLIDNESSYAIKKNSHTWYNLDIFNISSKIAPNSLKFTGLDGYIKRKFCKTLDLFKSKKSFYLEKKDNNKYTNYDNSFLKKNYSNNLFVEGYYESEKYFFDHNLDIRKEFTFKNRENFINHPLYREIKDSNSICVCLRQNRFSEGKKKISKTNTEMSEQFTYEQSNYIKHCIKKLKKTMPDTKLFLWSNDYNKLSNFLPLDEFIIVSTKKTDLDLFLMTQAKHYIVIPSSFNWWGAWLSENPNKIIFRPSNSVFSYFNVNNKDFWPNNWLEVNLNE